MHFAYILYSQNFKSFIQVTLPTLKPEWIFIRPLQTRKFTHNATDWAIVFSLAFNSKKQALLIEKHIKAMKSNVYIQNGIAYPEIAATLIQK